ncbi:DUF4916 domain-containing protein [Microbacterium sp. LMI1-1-1.1]|uniref:DUF4916 domain-containing protein n=1 Tax=Microbacterium sp. LMI1-1-1.1 TaxID=3135223 RepID=UPI003466EB43
MRFLPADLYQQIEQSIPLACVDFVPVRKGSRGREYGLIQRDSPFGVVWCHLGGRISRGESVREALLRHAGDTLAVGLDLSADPQPDYVYQWFPPSNRPADAADLVFGDDPRKHAIGLSFVVRALGDPQPRNEAHAFQWFAVGDRPEGLWPGCAALLDHLGV